MDVDWASVGFRVLHVGAAIVLVGGAAFMRWALLPAAEGLDDAEHDAFRERLLGRWKRFVHGGIAVVLASGLYNYLVVMRPLHKGDGLYHMLLGIKMLLALVLFFLASALVGRSKALEGLRTMSKRTLGVMLLLALVIVVLSGFLKIRSVPS